MPDVYECVKISLNRYNDFLKSKKYEKLLYAAFGDIRRIVENEKFNLDDEIHSKIFKIYERLCNKI